MIGHRLQRRVIGIGLILILFSGVHWSPAAGAEADERRLVVLGFSGADPDLVRLLMSRDELPALAALRDRGTFLPLETTTPASAEAAWASFATGLDPLKHGIFGPLRRIPGTYDMGSAWFDVDLQKHPVPYGSIFLMGLIVFLFLAALGLLLFKLILNANLRRSLFISLVIGLSAAAVLSVLLMRYTPRELPVIRPVLKQPAFWHLLNTAGIPACAVYAPASFPCGDETPGRLITGPGTPDFTLKGAHWSLYTDQPEFYCVPALGRIVPLSFDGQYADTFLPAAPVPGSEDWPVPLNLRYFKDRGLVQIDIRGRRDTLHKGEWSDYFIVRYKQNPLVDLFGMVRFYFCSDGDPFSLYMSPVHVFSRKPPPYFRHSSPFLLTMEGPLKDYNHESCDLHFDFEAAALGVLPMEGYLASLEQAAKTKMGNVLTLMENDEWQCFVSAFSFIDKAAHLDNPGDFYLEGISPELKRMYRLMDEMVSDIMKRCNDGKTDIVVFSPFSLASVHGMFGINCWLAEQGFLSYKEGAETGWRLADVDWSKTRAYSLGDGNLYLNLAGREPGGIVRPEEKQDVIQSLFDRLLNWDPDTKHIIVKKIFVPDVQAVDPDRKLILNPDAQVSDHMASRPDILIFFEEGLQALPEGIYHPPDFYYGFQPPEHYYRGHTSVAPDYVPGFLITSRPLDRAAVSLLDLAPTALDYFNCPIPEGMAGQSLW